MSPEQARGDTADLRSDVWGLGATLYFVLEGEPPLKMQDGRRTLRPFGQDTPPELAALCARALATEPGDRYNDASQLAAELARWLDGQRVTAYSYSAWDLFLRLVRRWRIPLTVAAIALAVLAVVTTTLFVRIQAVSQRAVLAESEAVSALQKAEVRLGEPRGRSTGSLRFGARS
jgi:hypothetical protein